MQLSEVKRSLNSIGKNNFVQFYEDYKQFFLDGRTKDSEERLIRKLLENNPKATKESGQRIRIGGASKIFENGCEKVALGIVQASKSSQIKSETKEKVEKLLRIQSQ